MTTPTPVPTTDSTVHKKSITKARRISRVVSRLAALALLAWCGRWVYVRLTTPAMTLEQALARYGPSAVEKIDDDATAELVAAVAAIPQPPSFNMPPPQGMKWVFKQGYPPLVDFEDIRRGEWAPDERAHLRAAIDYLTSPAMVSALATVESLRGRGFRSELRFGVGPAADQPGLELGAARQLAKLFAARARHQVAEYGDVQAAWDSLKTAIWPARVSERGLFLTMFVGIAIERLVTDEMVHFCRENTINPETAADMRATLDALPDLDKLLRQALGVELIGSRVNLATHFADTADGNGWLLLSEPQNAMAAPRSRAWNLLTVPHLRFKEVDKQLTAMFDDLRNIVALPLPARMAAAQRYGSETATGFVLGEEPLVPLQDWYNSGRIACSLTIFLSRQLATRNGVRIALALNQFRAQHSRYPASLEELAEQQSQPLPLDPFCQSHFHYQVIEGNKDYRLWSCDYDGVDDSGIPEFDNEQRNTPCDLVFTLPRGDPALEPKLEPIDGDLDDDGGMP